MTHSIPTPSSINWEHYHARLEDSHTIRKNGKVNQVIGLIIESDGPAGSVGELCNIYPPDKSDPIPAEIVGFKAGKVLLMPYGDVRGVAPESEVVSSGSSPTIKVGQSLLGRVLDGQGEIIDGKEPVDEKTEYNIYNTPPDALSRNRITDPISTGIRSIDSFLTIGKGQRMGIFSGSGVGKSVLLGMIARYTSADVNVIALIGERGREVREFIEKDLGEEGLKRSVVVVATSDKSPLIRIQGAMVGITIAEYFRDQGLDVMFMMDSVTRLATAQREIGLAVGEPPATRGYTPSVFSLLPKFLERAGTTSHSGSITGLYTVLVEGDDLSEPISDTVRATLDGHIVLSRAIANQGQYPAVDILQSISRLMIDIVPDNQRMAAQSLISKMATYKQSEDLVKIGAYKSGSNPALDASLKLMPEINKFLAQDIREKDEYDLFIERMKQLAAS